MMSYRRKRYRAALFVLVLSWIMWGGLVKAAVGHKLTSPTFGAFGEPRNVTVEQEHGNVFVTDSVGNKVDIFGGGGGAPAGVQTTVLSGTPPGTGVGSGAFDFRHEESAEVALDESNKYLYVADGGHSVVDKFKLNGSGEYEYVCRFTGYGRGCVESPSESPSWSEPEGVAVDSQGDLYVASFGPGHGAVYEFNSAGADLREFSGGDIGQDAAGKACNECGPIDVVVDRLGDIYVHNYQHGIVKIDSTGHESFIGEEKATSIAVDASNPPDLFIDYGSHIVEYNELGVQIGQFGENILGESEGIGVNSSDEIYASDKSAPEGEKIKPFAAVLVPESTTEAASSVKGTVATVAGTVTPEPEGLAASSFFEYGPCNSNTVSECPKSGYPLKTSIESVGSVKTPVQVQVKLTELTPETVYHYRLVGENENGANAGAEQTFTTGPAVAGLQTGGITNATPSNATLNGSLDPEGNEDYYFFQYGLASTYEKTGEYEVSFVGFTPTQGNAEEAVSSTIESLHPGWRYAYRIVAFDGNFLPSLTTFGHNETFTTPPAPPTVNDSPPFATGLAPHETTLHGVVNPGEGMTSYHFIYGLTTNYEAATPDAFTQLNYEDDRVEQILTGLRPGTVYHYALVASNASATVVGPDQQFVTSPEGVEPPFTVEPPGPPLGVIPSPSVVQPGTPALLPVPAYPAIHPLPKPGPPKCGKGLVRRGNRCVRRKPSGRGRSKGKSKR